MTRDELTAFLERVQVPSVLEYLGCIDRDDALEALEERMRWAAWNFRDDDRGWEAAFLLNHGHALRELLDEGEEAWWERTSRTSRPRRPERGGARDWQTMNAFMTPGVAPLREHPPRFDPETTLDAPLDLPLHKKSLRRGRNLPREDDQGVTLLPEAEDTPGPPPRRDDDEEEEIPELSLDQPDPFAEVPEEEFVGPGRPDVDPEEHTDPIGFTAARLAPPVPASEADTLPPGPPILLDARQIGDDEPTDPSGPRPVLRDRLPPAQSQTTGPVTSRAWLAGLVVGLIAVVAMSAAVAAAVGLSHLGERQGEELARQRAPEAHSSLTIEEPPAASPKASVVGSIWEGQSGDVPLRLVLTGSQGTSVDGTLVRLGQPTPQPIAVHGTFDEAAGSMHLEAAPPGPSLDGTVQGARVEGTWSEGGAVKHFTLKRQ